MRTIRQARLTSKRSARAAAGAACLSLAPTPKKSCVAANTTAPPSTSWTARMMTSARIARLIVGGDRLEQVREPLARGLAPGGYVLAWDAFGCWLVAAQDDLGHALAVDLVGPVVEACRAGVAVHGLERHVGRVPERAVDLQRTVDDVVQDLGAEELDQRDLAARRAHALGVHHPGGMEGHRPGGLHLRRRVGDPVLDRLLVREVGAVGLAGERVLAEHVERAIADP